MLLTSTWRCGLLSSATPHQSCNFESRKQQLLTRKRRRSQYSSSSLSYSQHSSPAFAQIPLQQPRSLPFACQSKLRFQQQIRRLQSPGDKGGSDSSSMRSLSAGSGEMATTSVSAREWIDNWRSSQSKKYSLSESGSVRDVLLSMIHSATGVCLLLFLDKTVFKSLTAMIGIKSIPSPLIGMFFIFALLLAGERVSLSWLKKGIPSEEKISINPSKTLSEYIESFFTPGLDWISRWLPLFYVPSLVVLPIVVKDIELLQLSKMLVIIIFGLLSSLLVTAQAAFSIRKIVQTKMLPIEPSKPVEPFSLGVKVGTVAVGLVSLVASVIAKSFSATSIGSMPQMNPISVYSATIFLISCTVGGYISGCQLPQKIKTLCHPIIFTAIVANIGAFVLGCLLQFSYFDVLKFYLLKGGANSLMGAGDIFMSFLGSVILSFGFRIYSQREIMNRHKYEVFGCVLVSALFSLFVTVSAGRILGLEPMLTRAIAPRSITVALALPIAASLGVPAASTSITAAAVVLTGLLGAALAQTTLNKFGFKGDPISRGLATAGSAHGLGTAALARDEPEALPFCALAYGLMGIVSTVLVSIKPIASALITIAG